ncbi:MAG TPA: DUF3592 domain-containing protein [Candidatus Saccharimonadales bacterium]
MYCYVRRQVTAKRVFMKVSARTRKIVGYTVAGMFIVLGIAIGGGSVIRANIALNGKPADGTVTAIRKDVSRRSGIVTYYTIDVVGYTNITAEYRISNRSSEPRLYIGQTVSVMVDEKNHRATVGKKDAIISSARKAGILGVGFCTLAAGLMIWLSRRQNI